MEWVFAILVGLLSLFLLFFLFSRDSGSLPGKDAPRPCRECGGTGYAKLEPNFMTRITGKQYTCSACRGSGYDDESKNWGDRRYDGEDKSHRDRLF